MPFALASIQTVKSSNQRELVAQWNRLAAGRGFPEIGEFQPPEQDVKQLVVWDVERDGGSRRFRMRQFGRFVAESTALPLAAGKTMDEVVPEPLRSYALAAANECVDSGCATYSVLTTVANGNLVDCERLLLPFGRNGAAVEQLIAMLQLISYQGAVDRHGIASEFEAKSKVGLSVAIAADPADEVAVAARRQRLAAVTAPPLAPDVVEVSVPPAEARSIEHRQAVRRTIHKTGRIRAGRLNEICTVRNMSATGAALELQGASKIPDSFSLVLEMESTGRPCAVVWRNDKQIGVRFE